MFILKQNTFFIEEADNLVDIADVLSNLGVFVPSSAREGGNKKVHCPFGFYHSDNGLSKAMRIYSENNTVYCFSCAKRYSSVSLASAAWGCPRTEAANRLLEQIGYKRKSLKDRWTAATEVNKAEIDLAELGEALKIYCSMLIEDWTMVQLEQSISSKLASCLSLLDKVKTDEDADKWLVVTKQAMKTTIEGYNDKINDSR